MQKIKVKLWNDWPISFSYWRKLNHAKKIQKKPLLLVLKAKNNWKQKPVESSSWESFNFPCILTMSSSLNLYHDPDYWYKTLCYITVILRQNLQLNTNQLLVTLLSHVYQWCCNITSTVVPVLEITAPYRSVLECRIIWRLRACLNWHYNTSGHVKQACKKSTGGLADHPQTLYMITSLTVWNLDVSHSCCSARWFAKGLTNLLVSNVCYIVSWIRTDSKMHQNCTQLILMVRSYPKKKTTTTTMNVNQY